MGNHDKKPSSYLPDQQDSQRNSPFLIKNRIFNNIKKFSMLFHCSKQNFNITQKIYMQGIMRSVPYVEYKGDES